jgi:D-beta-D-heptose 7-phosphate kinase/D-beta-D-heptose 1-phosphate adenosyltransferase
MAHVLVIGDNFCDRYHLGMASRLSPEAPIPVVKITSTFDLPGGAANVAANLLSLGIKVTSHPNYVLQHANLIPLNLPIKNRLIVDSYQLARWDERDWCSSVWVSSSTFKDYDAIVVADYNKGSLDLPTIEKLAQFDGPVFVDTKRDPIVYLGVADVMFPNWKEFEEFPAYHDFPLVIKKCGADGLIWRNYDSDSYHSPAIDVRVRSVAGCGDTVVAAFVAKWFDRGMVRDPEEMLRFCNVAAGLAASKPYTSTVTREEIERWENDH